MSVIQFEQKNSMPSVSLVNSVIGVYLGRFAKFIIPALPNREFLSEYIPKKNMK